jgi:uncharacterized protein (TIGR00159 family)
MISLASVSNIPGLLSSIKMAAGTIRPTDVLDMVIVGLIIYLVLVFAKKTKSFFVINSILILLVISSLAQFFDLGLTREILQPLLTFFIIIIVVVYQREMRNLFDWFSLSSRNLMFLKKISTTGEISSILVKALTSMAEDKIGAIIVLRGEYPLDNIVDGGFSLGGKVSTPLLLSIFDHHTPGHDGAVLINNHEITAFGIHLPLAEKYTKYSEHGTRHRAAVGITENTDALALVVSEEKGTISWAENGRLKKIEDREELENIIRTFLKENLADEKPSFWKSAIKEHLFIKAASVLLAVSLWFIFIYQVGFVTREFSIPVEFKNVPSGKTADLLKIKNITVDLAGRSSDFVNLDTNKITVSIDASLSTSSTQNIKIKDEMINVPSYFSVTSVKPEQITISITDVIKDTEQR